MIERISFHPSDRGDRGIERVRNLSAGDGMVMRPIDRQSTGHDGEWRRRRRGIFDLWTRSIGSLKCLIFPIFPPETR